MAAVALCANGGHCPVSWPLSFLDLVHFESSQAAEQACDGNFSAKSFRLRYEFMISLHFWHAVLTQSRLDSKTNEAPSLSVRSSWDHQIA